MSQPSRTPGVARPPLDARTAAFAAAAAIGVTMLVSTLYRWLHASWGDVPPVQFVQSSIMPAGLCAWFQLSRYKDDELSFRMIVGTLFFLLTWSASFLMTHGWPF